MDENVGKSPDRVENAEWQSRPKLDAEGVRFCASLCRPGDDFVSPQTPQKTNRAKLPRGPRGMRSCRARSTSP
jgi:hypothetical protein